VVDAGELRSSLVVPANERPQVAAGLCASCRHSEVVTSSRGSHFYMCRLSFADPRFAKYPALPVRACSGYVARDAEGQQ
jgi:hypothetical protein